MKRDLELTPILIIAAMLAYGAFIVIAACAKGCQ